jgi:hypothetical protein
MGVQIGMPLDQAVNILRLRGFRAQAAEAERLIERAGEDEADFPRSATGSPPLGLVVARSLVPTRWGTREIETHTTVVLERRVGGVSVSVQISAERSPEDSGDGSVYGAGRVFAIESYQDYAEADGPVGWFQIEAQLRRAAFAVPTCETLGERSGSCGW